MRIGSRIAIGMAAVVVAGLMLGGTALASAHPVTGVPLARNSAGPAVASGAKCNYLTFIYYATATYNGNETSWQCTLHATDVLGHALTVNGWSNTIFEVFCYAACNSKITISDYGYAGDYYSLWVTDDSTLATDWGEVGVTPQVATSSELAASGYNSHWTGTGSTYSQKTFIVYDPGGVHEYFAVHDNLMNAVTKALDGPCGVTAATLLASGCTATGISMSTGWNPAGFDSTWTEEP